jgi:hypothetical protein
MGSPASPVEHRTLVPRQGCTHGHTATSKEPSGKPASPARAVVQQIEDLLLVTAVSDPFSADVCFTGITRICLLVWLCTVSELPVPQQLALQTFKSALTLVCSCISGQNRVAWLTQTAKEYDENIVLMFWTRILMTLTHLYNLVGWLKM